MTFLLMGCMAGTYSPRANMSRGLFPFGRGVEAGPLDSDSALGRCRRVPALLEPRPGVDQELHPAAALKRVHGAHFAPARSASWPVDNLCGKWPTDTRQ